MSLVARLAQSAGTALRHARPLEVLRSSSSPLQPAGSSRSFSETACKMDREVAWSGKEHTDSMETQPQGKAAHEVENNPTGIEHPEEFHPDGSNSEQIIAGERSDFDPLAERLKKNGGSFRGKIAMDAHEDPDSVREMSAPLTDIPEDTLHRSGP